MSEPLPGDEEQHALFDVDPDWTEHWRGMPDYSQEDLQPWQSIYVHFATQRDREDFAKLVGQTLHAKTKFIWHPKAEIRKASDKVFTGAKVTPRYPIYIISKGRWDSRLTVKALEFIGVPYHIVVEPQELEQYAAVIDSAKILVTPFSNLGQGGIPARNFVWEHSIASGAARHWILDDNISGFCRFQDNLKVELDNGATFCAIEDWCDRYENVMMAAFNYDYFAPRKQGAKIKPITLNTRCYSGILLDNRVTHRWRGRYNEDTDLSLRILKDGHCTALFNAFLMYKKPTLTMKGGNTDELYKGAEATAAEWTAHVAECRAGCKADENPRCDAGRAILSKDGRWLMAESLREQHPDCTRVERKWERWQHQVDYRAFRPELGRNVLKLKDGVVIPEESAYALTLDAMPEGEGGHNSAGHGTPIERRAVARADGPSVLGFLDQLQPAPQAVPDPVRKAPEPEGEPALAGPGQPEVALTAPMQLAADLASRGHRLLTTDGKFFVSDASTLTDDDRARIKKHREALIQLAEPWSTDPVVAVVADGRPRTPDGLGGVTSRYDEGGGGIEPSSSPTISTASGQSAANEPSIPNGADSDATRAGVDEAPAPLPPERRSDMPVVAAAPLQSEGLHEEVDIRTVPEGSIPLPASYITLIMAPSSSTPAVSEQPERRYFPLVVAAGNAEQSDAAVPVSSAENIHDGLIPEVSSGAQDQHSLFASTPTQTLAQFLGNAPSRRDESFVPDEPPILDGIQDVVLNFATDGLDWANGARAVGVTVSTLDGKLTRFLPFAFKGGGNLDQATIERWGAEQLKGKKIHNANTRFDLHIGRRLPGFDLEAQGCTFTDIQHTAALLDDHRKQFRLDKLAADYLPSLATVGRVDESRHAEYHASEVAQRERFTAELVWRLRDVMYPLIEKEELQAVQSLEDDVIPAVVEMEENGSPLNLDLLEQYHAEANTRHDALLWEIAGECGFAFDHTAKSWQRLFERLGLPPTDGNAEAIIAGIDHPLVKKAHLAAQYASLDSKTFKAYRENVRDGILRFDINQLRGDDGGTVSGRFSIGYVQQVPNKDNHSAVFGDELFPRRLFVAGRGDYLEADAMQIEQRLLVHYANNASVIAEYDGDLERLMRGEEPVSYHKVTWKRMKAYKPDMLYTHQKSFNFAFQYGAKSIKLAVMMGFITEAEGDEIRRAKRWDDPRLKVIKEIEAAYKKMMPEGNALLDVAAHLAKPECDQYCKRHDALHRQYAHRGYVKTLLGRRSRFPNHYKTYIGLNRVLQGTGADILKRKTVELHNERKRTGFVMRMTVHDAFGGDATTPETRRLVSEILNRQSYDLKVPILWDVKTGPTWADCK